MIGFNRSIFINLRVYLLCTNICKYSVPRRLASLSRCVARCAAASTALPLAPLRPLSNPTTLSRSLCTSSRGLLEVPRPGASLQKWINKLQRPSETPKKMNGDKKEKDPRADRIVWVDCEMTGLEVDSNTLVEIAVIVTDKDLMIVAEGPDIVIHQSEEVLSSMSEWCKGTFAENGLTEKIRKSTVDMKDAEEQVLAFLTEHVPAKVAPLAGNTIYMDKIFIAKYMPRVADYLHYRLIDVSTIKELSRRWYPSEAANAPAKMFTHRALDDIRESIAELAYYRTSLFK